MWLIHSWFFFRVFLSCAAPKLRTWTLAFSKCFTLFSRSSPLIMILTYTHLKAYFMFIYVLITLQGEFIMLGQLWMSSRTGVVEILLTEGFCQTLFKCQVTIISQFQPALNNNVVNPEKFNPRLSKQKLIVSRYGSNITSNMSFHRERIYVPQVRRALQANKYLSARFMLSSHTVN